MAEIIDMPKLSDTMSVGTLVKWNVKEGQTVAFGDILGEVETDKATMELSCTVPGTTGAESRSPDHVPGSGSPAKRAPMRSERGEIVNRRPATLSATE